MIQQLPRQVAITQVDQEFSLYVWYISDKIYKKKFPRILTKIEGAFVSNAPWTISSLYEVFWCFYQVPKDNLFSINAHCGKIWITFFMCSLPKKISFLAEKFTARYQRYFKCQVLYLLWLIFNTEYQKAYFFLFLHYQGTHRKLIVLLYKL